MGTLPYMSPEQVTGNLVDTRTDVFAFGAVLFEMITGRRLFGGESGAEITSAILRDEPPQVDPPALDRLIQRCLAKDADQRWQSIQDVGAQLAWVSNTPEVPPRPGSPWIPLAVGAAVVLSVAVLAWPGLLLPGEKNAVPNRIEPMHASVTLGRGQRFIISSRLNLAISRDGKAIAFIARQDGVQQLFVRRFSEPSATSLGVVAAVSPFFSPDGQWVGFLSLDGRLSKMAVTGGPATTLTEASDIHGALWTAGGEIVFARNEGPLWVVSDAGGPVRALTQLDAAAAEQSHKWPFALPDGRTAFVASSDGGSRVFAFDARNQQRGVLLENATWATWVAGQRLLFSRRRQLFTVPTDSGGNPTNDAPIQTNEPALMNDAGVPFLALSDSGNMIFLSESDERQRSLMWVDPSGRVEPVPAPPRPYRAAVISPDGRRVVLNVASGGDSNVWLYDFEKRALTALTTDGRSTGQFAWSPDGRELMYASVLPLGSRNIRRMKVDAPALTELVAGEAISMSPVSWLRDGRLTFHRYLAQTNGDVMLLNLADRRVTPLVERPGTQWSGRVSADGEWLAFVSNESGRFEAMVARLSEPNRQWQVSLGGGQEVVWSRTGLELYYRTDTALMAATINPNADPPIGGARRLLDNRYLFEPSVPGVANYDVGADGRFLMIAADDDPNALTLRVIFNWAAGLAPPATAR